MIKMSDVHTRHEKAAQLPPSPIITLKDINRRRREGLATLSKNKQDEFVQAGYVRDTAQMALSPWSKSGVVVADNYLYNVMRDGDWAGRRCFIVGGGPSLKGFKWAQLDGEISIGVNRAFEKFDPSMILSMDARVWKWIEDGTFGEDAARRFAEFKGIKCWVSNHCLYPEDIYVVMSDYDGKPTIGTVRKIQTGWNSGYAALNLAAALGANPIYLLGFDMKGTGKGSQKWWHNGYPVNQNESVYVDFIDSFRRFAPVLKSAGIRVVNLSKTSALDCFEKSTIERVLADEPRTKSPLTVSFFTPGTGYEKEAAKLMFSCKRFGVEYDVRPLANTGGWLKNVNQKAEFVGRMLREHPGRDIVWVDSDATICAPPVWFNTVDCDIAVHVVDWQRYGRDRAPEMLAGTIYFRNTPAVLDVVDQWAALCANTRNGNDQVILKRVLDSVKDNVRIGQLPASYCQIFDSMCMEGEPVIEHHQASRQFRNTIGEV